MEEVIEFLKKLFGDDFEARALSTEEGEIKHINELSEKEVEDFFIYHLKKNVIWYDPVVKVLYSYKPEEDSYFKKAVTNAWAFKYIFYPVFIEGWGSWWSDYVFRIYEKGLDGNYKLRYAVK